MGEQIGEGFFGTVAKGTVGWHWHTPGRTHSFVDQVTLADITVDVAIKSVKDEAKTRSLLEEAVIMAQLDHPNLV